MTGNSRRRQIALIAAVALCLVGVAHADPPKATVKLLAARTGVVPGEPLHLALAFDTEGLDRAALCAAGCF